MYVENKIEEREKREIPVFASPFLVRLLNARDYMLFIRLVSVRVCECAYVRVCLFIVPFPWVSVFFTWSRVNAHCILSTWNTFFFKKTRFMNVCGRRSCIHCIAFKQFVFGIFPFFNGILKRCTLNMSQNCWGRKRENESESETLFSSFSCSSEWMRILWGSHYRRNNQYSIFYDD